VFRAFLSLVLLVPGSFAAAESLASRQLSFGLMVAQKGLWQEARFRFERALALDPKNAAALNDLAVTLEQMGEFEKARECYEKALALKPGDMYIQQNFDLFREADDKRNRKGRKAKSGVKPVAATPARSPGDGPPATGPDRPTSDEPPTAEPERPAGDGPPATGSDRPTGDS
jgi:tetratricopeptide (TPR) repeat protein